MIFRIFLIMSFVIGLAACSSNPETTEVGDIRVQTREDITPADNSPLSGTEVYDRELLEGPAPGTQQDLVVNVGDRVFFGYDQYDLTPEARKTLDMQAEWLRQYPNLNITIEGHCDERGTREYNLALGEKRANAVKKYLTALGIDGKRIALVSYGKERPAVLGSNPEAWAQNRRSVTIVD